MACETLRVGYYRVEVWTTPISPTYPVTESGFCFCNAKPKRGDGMNERKQIEEIAIIDGLVVIGHNSLGMVVDQSFRDENGGFLGVSGVTMLAPAYLASLDACQRVIERMTDDELTEYAQHLDVVTMNNRGVNSYQRNIMATPAQVTEAILKAHGVWWES